MTLREALQSVDRNKVYQLINEKDQGYILPSDRLTMDTVVKAYGHVIEELLSKPKTTPHRSYSWLIKENIDPIDNQKYPDVCFLNLNYVKPPEGLKPWGGNSKDKIPDGYYDGNDEKYSETFAAGFTPWSKLIDTPIINEAGYPLEKAVAELLWELTFYGWTEEKVKEATLKIEKQLDEAIKEIDNGKYIEFDAEKLFEKD
jgi:hypothetical protein